MAASLSGVWNAQNFTDSGELAALYRLYTYAPATTTHKIAYTEVTGTTAHTYTSDGGGGQYIALNARGELPAPLFFLTGGYDLCLKTPAGATVWTRRAYGTDEGADTLRADLADESTITKGMGQVGYLPTTAYSDANSGGAWLNILCSRSPAEIAAGVTPTVWQRDQGDVRRYGATGDGVTNDYAALVSAWDVVKTAGGVLYLKPGSYLTDTQWNLTRASPVNIKIEGWGAVMYAGSLVTGAHVQVNGSYNFSELQIEGLQFNHRNNTTAQGCFEMKNAHAVTLDRCNVEMHNTKAGWYFAKLATSTPGASENDLNSFWCRVLGCSTRARSGGDGTVGAYGVLLEGAANATTIRDCIWSSLDVGIRMNPGATNYTLGNAVLIERNHFETITTAAMQVSMTPAELGPTGLVVAFNRVEACPTFFSIFTGGAAATEHSQPPLLFGNYCTAGSVTTWVSNPTSYPVSTMETRTPGFGPAFSNNWYMPSGLQMWFTEGSGLTLSNASGSGDYNTGWLKQSGYTYWTNTGNGDFYVNSGTPTTNTDGTVVGTQT